MHFKVQLQAIERLQLVGGTNAEHSQNGHEMCADDTRNVLKLKAKYG